MTKDLLHSIVRLRYNLMATFNEGIAIGTAGLTTICRTSDIPFNECINAVFIGKFIGILQADHHTG